MVNYQGGARRGVPQPAGSSRMSSGLDNASNQGALQGKVYINPAIQGNGGQQLQSDLKQMRNNRGQDHSTDVRQQQQFHSLVGRHQVPNMNVTSTINQQHYMQHPPTNQQLVMMQNQRQAGGGSQQQRRVFCPILLLAI